MTAHDAFAPFGAITGIGSLPFMDAEDAVRLVADACPEIPFWPQLPRRSTEEGIVEQHLATLAGLLEPRRAYGYRVRDGCLEDAVDRLTAGNGALDATRAAGFFAFRDAALAGTFGHAQAVKGQVEGPVTLAFHLFHGDTPFANDARLLDAVTRHVIALARWQVHELRRAGRPVLLFLDEPALHVTEHRPDLLHAIQRVLRAVREAGAITGLHCCADLEFVAYNGQVGLTLWAQ